MKKYFVIEDVAHAEIIGEFETKDLAISKLLGLKKLGWRGENICPCTCNKTCLREYELTGYEKRDDGIKEIYGELVFEIGKNINKWYLNEEKDLVDFGEDGVCGKEVLNFLKNIEK